MTSTNILRMLVDGHTYMYMYRIAGKFRGVPIFVIFVVDSPVTKFSPLQKINYY